MCGGFYCLILSITLRWMNCETALNFWCPVAPCHHLSLTTLSAWLPSQDVHFSLKVWTEWGSHLLRIDGKFECQLPAKIPEHPKKTRIIFKKEKQKKNNFFFLTFSGDLQKKQQQHKFVFRIFKNVKFSALPLIFFLLKSCFFLSNSMKTV